MYASDGQRSPGGKLLLTILIGMLGEHNHHRVGARIMLGTAVRADARPAAAVWLGRLPADRTVQVPAMPIGKAERSGKGGRLMFVEDRQQMNMGIGVGRGIAVRQVREPRRLAVKAEKQRGLAGGWAPAELALLIEDRRAIGPHQLQGVDA